MDYIILGLISAATLLVFLYYRMTEKHENLPPCPVKPWPVIGHLLAMNSDQRLLFRKWHKECGEIYSLYMGTKLLVVLNGYSILNETLMKRAEDFSDRPEVFILELTGFPRSGIIESSGKLWKEHRTVTLHILRSFGLGQNSLTVRIQDEIDHYLDHLASFRSSPVDIQMATNISTSNIICSILSGKRLEYKDELFQRLVKQVHGLIETFSFTGLVSFLPFLRFLPGDIFRVKKVKAEMKELFALFDTFIEQCRRGESSGNFVEEYLREEAKRKAAQDATTMDDGNLRKCMFDLFVAGSETTSTTIYWFVLYMINYPDIQKKIFDEICEHVGRDQAPMLQDRSKLTQMNAAILETQRVVSIAPIAFFHTCPRDVTLRGFTIPKGAYIIPSLDSILHDENVWGQDVMSFRPDRFLDQDGKLKIPEEFIPFSIGKRACLGESMANTELFLYLANMLQRFEFQAIDPDRPPPLNYIYGLTINPEPYKVKVLERQKQSSNNS